MGSVILCLLLLLLMPDLRKSTVGSKSPKLDHEDETSISVDLSKHRSKDGLLAALSNSNTLLIIPVFLVGIFRYTTLNILIQYASVQFGMRISMGATFYTETAIVNIGLFMFIIPQLTSYVREKYSVRPQVIDLFLVRCSVCLMCIGCVFIGLARSSKILPIGKSQHSIVQNFKLIVGRRIHIRLWIRK